MKNGKLEHLQPNLIFDYDFIAGTCFFVGDDSDHCEFKSLTDEQIEEVKQLCKEREFISPIKYENLDEKEIERWNNI